MKKYLPVILILCGLIKINAQKTQSNFIDSLKKEISILTDTNKVNTLNLLAQTFSTANNLNWQQKADSVFYYANIASNEAERIGYKKGSAQSLANLGHSEFLRGIPLRIKKQNDSVPVDKAEKYLLQALAIAREINDDNILGYVYYDLSDILFFKSKRQDLTVKGEYLKKAIYYFYKSGNEDKEAEACTWLCEEYTRKGLYEQGIEYCQRSMELSQKVVVKAKTPEQKEYRNYLVQQSLENMAELFKIAGDYETALLYLRQARLYGIKNATGWEMEYSIAETFRLNGRSDSALYYTNMIMEKHPKSDNEIWFHGRAYLFNKEYNKALPLLKAVLDSMNKKSSNATNLAPLLLQLAEVYKGQKNYHAALMYTRQATNRALKFGARPTIRDGYELLSELHYLLGKNDSAYLYLLKYTTLKDSIQNKQFLWRLNNYKIAAEDEKKKAQLGFLMRDNKIKQQQLKQQTLFKNFLFVLLLALLLTGIFVIRNTRLKRKYDHLRRKELEQQLNVQQLESAKQQAELQQKASELEMQALRAQMNPHFIFNCLSSINRFILKNETEAASDYLTRFSRLIRMVLINSQQPLVSLEDELEMLRLYLDMERLRFKNAFDYNIIFTNRVNAGSVYIPPLLLQPFCENAIWHGLMHKEEKGHLSISLSMEESVLHCHIEDDGIGRQKAMKMNSKSVEKDKSLGLKITTERLALLNGEKGITTFYEIGDVLNEEGRIVGTKVNLRIKCKGSEKEYV